MPKRIKDVVVVDDERPVVEEAPLATRLRKLIIQNFGCIGSTPVEIELDQIVVLVGPNNAGKSTILRAYHKITSGPKPTLSCEEFPCGKIVPGELPTVELHVAYPEGAAAERWLGKGDGEYIVRERWVWSNFDEPAKRQGFDVKTNEWSDEKPFGWDNVAASKRPIPHRIHAFAPPEERAKEVSKLLLSGILSQVKNIPRVEKIGEAPEKATRYGELLAGVAELQKELVEGAKKTIDAAEQTLTQFVGEVFNGYEVKFDARPEEDLESAFSPFQAGATLRMGPSNGHLSDVEHQGSGAQRTLLWAALRYVAEKGKDADSARTKILLLDEPELCLHPSAVRDACTTLYKLADGKQWQVMVTTHSAAFIDLHRDNTTVVRVERSAAGDVKGTTVFRPKRVNLDPDDKKELKLLNLFDPYVAEFFFGGQTILVEGDTEYTAFKYVASLEPNEPAFRNLHVVRARGKVTIGLLARILNQFGARYAVLHDSDSPTTLRKGKLIVNPAWTNNAGILKQTEAQVASGKVRLIAAVPHFEGAVFGTTAKNEKPYGALEALRESAPAVQLVRMLLLSLIDGVTQPPARFSEWNNINGLQTAFDAITGQLEAAHPAVPTVNPAAAAGTCVSAEDES